MAGARGEYWQVVRSSPLLDAVDCGPGPDRAEVDKRDVLKGCETVKRV